MKRNIFYIILLMLTLINIYAVKYEIKQDGTGDYPTIQEGIDQATDTDTVLVFPGTYYENVVIQDKSITLASLALTTGDINYKYNTIINGNQASSCVQVRGEYTWDFQPIYNDSVFIKGFTLTNGIGTEVFEGDKFRSGGGVLVFFSTAKISDCVIKRNSANGVGGGVHNFDSNIYLSGVSIHHNKSREGGGGITLMGMNLSLFGKTIFDPENRCNIYNNQSNRCNDLLNDSTSPFSEVIVDTFTVNNPNLYYIAHLLSSGQSVPDLISLDMQNSYFEMVESDLYVSPSGNDNNTGLTVEEPLQTIAHALNIIKADSLHHRKIYLADGIYSETENNQWFPIHAKSYVSIIGESESNTIVDAEDKSVYFRGTIGIPNYTIKNITFKNGYGLRYHTNFFISDPHYRYENIHLENLKFIDSQVKNVQIAIHDVHSTLKNIDIENNEGGGGSYISNKEPRDILIENCRISNNQQIIDPDIFRARPLFLSGAIINTTDYFPKYTIINTEISNCADRSFYWPESAGAIYTSWYSKVNIVNSTIGDNTTIATSGAGICFTEKDIVNIYNSIIYGNEPRQIVISNREALIDGPTILNLSHSLIEEGNGQVHDLYGENEINWLEGNLREDPLWHITEHGEYYLSQNSPCIDAGTLDLPEGVELPEYDLAGNPRIYGGGIDMGAYEWNPDVSNENITALNDVFSLSNYPNPFNPMTNIEFSIPKAMNVEISIYNVRGQKVKTLIERTFEAGRHTIIWNGKNDKNESVSSGIYYSQLKTETSTKVTKMILLK